MTMTAKHFQEPLLQVLGDLTGLKAGLTVRGEDTYVPVMSIMGIPDIDHLGTEAGSDQPRVQRLIQWACKNLRKTGLVELEKRGHWSLTSEGVVAAMNIASATEVSPVAPPPVKTPAAPASIDPPVTVQRGPMNDPYILSLILDQTTCLGHYTPHQGATCTVCPITAECRNQQYANYSRLALKYAQAVPAGAATPTQAATPTASPVSRKLNIGTMRRIQAFEETVCAVCSLLIQKNAACYWAEDIVTEESQMIHISCGDELE